MSVRKHVNLQTLDRICLLDPAVPPQLACWRTIRANIAFAAASRPALLQEAPLSCLGYILLLLAEQVLLPLALLHHS